MVGVMLALFLAALDQTIVSTALPRIVQAFRGPEHLSWVLAGQRHELSLLAVVDGMGGGAAGDRASDVVLRTLGNVLSPGEFSNFVPDSGATQETTVDYGAISAELAFGGLRINIVPKEGGNTFAGFFNTSRNSGKRHSLLRWTE